MSDQHPPQKRTQPKNNKASTRRYKSVDNRTPGNADPRTDKDEKDYDKDYDKVKVLVLTFGYSDINLKNETKKIVKLFEGLKYEVDKFTIPMGKSLEKLRGELENFLAPTEANTLLIIYYHGHGGIEADRTLFLASHNVPDNVNELWRTILHLWGEGVNLPKAGKHLRKADDDRIKRFRPVAEIRWTDISSQIMQAEFDTLMILDCCNAGLAAASSQEEEALNDPGQPTETVTRYRKELIGASSWGTDTDDRMSPALLKSLDDARREGFSSISTPSLVRRMNNCLVREIGGTDSPAQAVHYILQRNNADKMILDLPPAQEEDTTTEEEDATTEEEDTTTEEED